MIKQYIWIKNIEAYFNKALALTSLEKMKDAIEAYDMVISLNPNDVESYYNKALILMNINKYPDAEKCLQKVIDILNTSKSPFSKNLDNIYYNMSKCKTKLKKNK